MKLFSNLLPLAALLPIGCMAGSFQCPSSIDLAPKNGWNVVKLDSEILRRKPNVLVIPKNDRVTVTHNQNDETDTSFPEEMSDAKERPDGSVSYEWSFLPAAQSNPIYVSCIYKGEGQLYARKLLPQEVTHCSTERKATGVYAKLLTCK